MAELTMLESKLGEVLGLAMAAQDTGAKVRKLAEKEQAAARLVRKLDRMAKQAAETEERCLEIAERMKGKTPAIMKKARNAEVRKLAEWAIPIQRKHLDTALRGSQKLAAWEDPKAGLK